ncbi:MAG: HAMP domain-containing protein [Myxococcales bacterium]|nr:HAMP domain-containing protein [Myxococcales bacterium]
MTTEGAPLRSTTGRRILAAFGAVLVLFGIALSVQLTTLHKIGEAESEVARLDHAKHAGHMAAAQVREQYIHQAHTLIEFGPGHLGHYQIVVEETNRAIQHLESVSETASDKQLATQIAALAHQNDRDFRTIVVPAITRGDREAVAKLGDGLEEIVDRVVDLNEQLNADLEARSIAARERAESLRSQSVTWTIVCFALAIVLATGVGLWLMRTIVRRVEALRAGARRVGSGDLSARIVLEGHDEFAELASSFNQMAASLSDEQAALVKSQKLASIGQVAAGVAHEINNPLSVILGYTKLLRKEGSAHAEELQIIEDEARLCQRIVSELLELARPQRLETSAVDLAEIAREAIERLTDAGALRDRSVQLLDGPAVVVSADAGKLRQVIANVVVNAAEATPPSGTITIDAKTRGDEATLTVADDGPGIPPEVQNTLFEPFVTTKPKGTGLGLAIAQAIVDAHGGRISVESSPDAGTRVSLRLPVSHRAEAAAR